MNQLSLEKKKSNEDKAIRPCSQNRGVNRHVSLIYLTMENVRPGRVPLWPAKLAMTRLLEGISWMMEGLCWAHQFHNHLPLHTCNSIRPLVQIEPGSQSSRQPADKGSRKPLLTIFAVYIFFHQVPHNEVAFQIHSTDHDVDFIRVWMSFGKARGNVLRMAILVFVLSPLTSEDFQNSSHKSKPTLVCLQNCK